MIFYSILRGLVESIEISEADTSPFIEAFLTAKDSLNLINQNFKSKIYKKATILLKNETHIWFKVEETSTYEQITAIEIPESLKEEDMIFLRRMTIGTFEQQLAEGDLEFTY